jgi:hypothetical protein
MSRRRVERRNITSNFNPAEYEDEFDSTGSFGQLP